MTTLIIRENELEQRIISLLQEQGYLYSSGQEIQRDSSREVFILSDLRDFLKKKHPKLSSHDIRIIADEIQLDSKNLYEFNKEFIQETLIEGKSYNRESDGGSFLLKLIDFEHPNNNIFRVVNQLIVQEYETRRVDLVIYINGIPFVVWELKSPTNQFIELSQAYQQVKAYVNGISSLFKYNAFVVLCDGISTKLGSIWSEFEHFYEWKKLDDYDAPRESTEVTTIEGLFNKEVLVKVIEDFICFSDRDTRDKIISRYHQFFGTRKLLESITKKLKPKGTGQGGIYHGTTGCGKSYIMLFLSRLLMRSKDFKKRPIILLITDRNELNDQLSKLFSEHSNFLQVAKANIKKVDSRGELRTLFKRFSSGSIFLTNIQKFSESNELLTDDNNVICISDEAHRSQHNLEKTYKEDGDNLTYSVPFAKRVHDSLPNATYVGFTATPKDETMSIFGDVVAQYGMWDSKHDGFTVEVISEFRRVPLDLEGEKVETLENLIVNSEKIEGEFQENFLKMKRLIELPERVNHVVRDIIAHYEKRESEGATVKGKAIVVVNSREVGYEMYKLFKKERPEWFKQLEEAKGKFMPKVNLVMTRELKDKEREKLEGEEGMYELIGDDDHQRTLAKEFKDEDSNFKIAIVRDKWLTGFDVPCLDTMYLDRIMYDANLYQAASRVNRSYPKKEFGLIVNYLPVSKALAEARKKYGGERDLGNPRNQEDLVISTKDKLELLEELFYGFDKSPFFGEDQKKRFQCIWDAVNWIESRANNFENRFIARFTDFRREYSKCVTNLPEDIREQSSFFTTLYAVYVKKYKKDSQESRDHIELRGKMEKLFEQAFLVIDPKILFLGAIQVSCLTEEDLQKICESGNVHQVTKRLFHVLEKANREFTKINSKKGLSFSEKLMKLKDRYNSLESVIKKEKLTAEEVEHNQKVDKQAEEIKDELVELGREYIQANESYKNLGLSRLETVFYEILLETRDHFKIEFSEEKLIDLSKELKQLVIEQSKQIDWWKRDSIKATIGMKMTLLLAKHGYSKKGEKIIAELQEEVIRRSVEFKKHYEGEWS